MRSLSSSRPLWILALTFLSAPGLIGAQADGALRQLTPHTWAWIASDDRSANSALIVGDSAALVVDPGLTPEVARAFLAAVKTVTTRPIRWAVLTHWHPDHALGATCLPNRGFTVAAHPKTRRALAERGAQVARNLSGSARTDAERNDLLQCRVGLSGIVIPERRVFDLGGRQVTVFHPGWAHTAGDLVVWEPDEQVLVTGDIVMHNASPDMGEAHPIEWASIIDSLVALQPAAVVAGHFGPSDINDLRRFGDYLHALVDQVRPAVAPGIPADRIARSVRLPGFSDFGQYPQYNATIEGNAARVVEQLRSQPARRGTLAGFVEVASIDVGQNPHQIAFSSDGRTAYVAVAGSDRVAVVDAMRYQVRDTISTPGTPLGVLPVGEASLVVTRFQRDSIARYGLGGKQQERAVGVDGTGASLFHGPLPNGQYLLSVESANRLLLLDPTTLAVTQSYPTGKRPFPPAATPDGRLAFVPNYDDGTVSIIDLWNRRVIDTVMVGEHPSGGVVLPGDVVYAVAIRGEDKIRFINTASHHVVDSLVDGIGRSPFSVVLSPDGRLAFVNNTASHDISVVALPERRVIARIPTPDIPIVMAVHPTGSTLWVSSEGVHRVTVFSIPASWHASVPTPQPGKTEVAVMGMIHSAHLTSDQWGLNAVEQAIRRFRPDAICAEIAPDRWERIWSDFTERGVIEDPRVLRFPEYVRTILPLSIELGFTIAPCAGWTQEMSDLRQTRIAQFNTDPGFAEPRAAYAERLATVRSRHDHPLNAIDDPAVIHSSAYDDRTREELDLYDEYQNDVIGPGGWTNINRAHLALIDSVVRTHPRQRLLITFGAGHKYRFLDALRRRDDIDLMDLRPFLP